MIDGAKLWMMNGVTQMAKITIKDILSMGKKRKAFDFDSLTANPLHSYIPQPAIDIIYRTICDPRL